MYTQSHFRLWLMHWTYWKYAPIAVRSTLKLWFFHRNSGGCTKVVKPRWLEAASIVIDDGSSSKEHTSFRALWLAHFAPRSICTCNVCGCQRNLLPFFWGLGPPWVGFPSLPDPRSTPASGPSQLSGPIQVKPPLSRFSTLGLSKRYPSLSFLVCPSPSPCSSAPKLCLLRVFQNCIQLLYVL